MSQDTEPQSDDEGTTISAHVYDPAFAEDPPNIPEGATGWERQEARRAWEEAHSNLAYLVGAAERVSLRLNEKPEPRVDASTFSGGGGSVLHYYAIAAEMSAVRFASILDGIRHRVAVQARATTEAQA